MRRLALVALSILAVSCSSLRASPPPSDLATAVPSPSPSLSATISPTSTRSAEPTITSPSPQVTPTPTEPMPTEIGPSPSPTPVRNSQTPSVSASPSIRSAHFDSSQIRTVLPPFWREIGYWAFSQSGPLVTLSDFDSWDQRDLYLADLADQSINAIATPEMHDVFSAAISGTQIVWVDAKYDGYEDDIPCGAQGGVTWKIKLTDALSGTTREIASGRNDDVEVCTADAPVVAINRALFAYAAPHPGAGHPRSWQITVANVSDGSVVRTIDTDRTVFDLAIDGGDVAYVDGAYKKGGDFWPDLTWLRLDRGNGSGTIALDENVEGISFVNGRLAWQSYRDGEPSQAITATVDDLSPVVVGTDWWWPVTSGDAVFFAGTVFDSTIRPAVWDSATGQLTRLDGLDGASHVSAEDGWFVWIGAEHLNDVETPFVRGAPIDALTVEDP